MAITLEANYSKKLGLPGFSSHQFSITVRREVSDIHQIPAQSAELYVLLQECVDRDIQRVGFLPPPTNGNGNGSHKNGHHAPAATQVETWACTEKQRNLILKIVEDNHLDKVAVDSLAMTRFRKPVKQLNRLEASGLIEELLETHGGNNGKGGRNGGTPYQKARTA